MKKNPTHCFSNCPDLLRALGYPPRDADGAPLLGRAIRAIVSADQATCPTCRDHGRATWGLDGSTVADGLRTEEGRREGVNRRTPNRDHSDAERAKHEAGGHGSSMGYGFSTRPPAIRLAQEILYRSPLDNIFQIDGVRPDLNGQTVTARGCWIGTRKYAAVRFEQLNAWRLRTVVGAL